MSAASATHAAQEFYAAATRKLRMPQPTVRALADALLELPLVIVTPAHIRSAMDHELRYQISFWDGLILAAAELAARTSYTPKISTMGSNTVRSKPATRSARTAAYRHAAH